MLNRFQARIPYLGRLAAVALSHPAEAVDRIAGRLERERENRGAGFLASYEADIDADWETTLHRLLGLPCPCDVMASMPNAWDDLNQSFATHGLAAEMITDADPTLSEAVLCLVRHLRPQKVVETGVGRGVLTQFVLHGLEANGRGRLWSIDLPPLNKNWQDQTAVAVPERLRGRWTYLRGSSKRVLPSLLDQLGEIDMFIHDSLHTETTMRFEFELAWSRLGRRGVLVADDIDASEAFKSLVGRATNAHSLVVREEVRGIFGIILKDHILGEQSGAPVGL